MQQLPVLAWEHSAQLSCQQLSRRLIGWRLRHPDWPAGAGLDQPTGAAFARTQGLGLGVTLLTRPVALGMALPRLEQVGR